MVSSRVPCSYPSCNCSFQSQQAMLQHCRDRHNSHPLPPKNPCHLCNRSFPTSTGLQDHLRAAHHQRDIALAAASTPTQDTILMWPQLGFVTPSLLPPDRHFNGVACNDCGRCLDKTDDLHRHQWDSPGHTRVCKTRNPNYGSSVRVCSQCAQHFRTPDDLEQHYVEQHPIAEISRSDEGGTWQHLAERFRTAWKKPSIKLYEVQGIFKVYNPGWRRKEFEEYRKELKQEMANQKLVKEENEELRNKVLHDGNEMRRYHGTTVKCRLGRPPSTANKSEPVLFSGSLCNQSDCNMCRIIQSGFKKSKCKVERFQRFGPAIYCSSISSKASAYVHCHSSSESSFGSSILNCILEVLRIMFGNDATHNYKVMMACKILAGRPFRSTYNLQHLKRPPPGFHSVQGDPGVHLNYDELVLYDDRAILPDFIILYSSSD